MNFEDLQLVQLVLVRKTKKMIHSRKGYPGR